MLAHCKMILETDGGRIAINPHKFDKLITSIRTAVDNDGILDKECTSYNDMFDAFRLALKFYHFEKVDQKMSCKMKECAAEPFFRTCNMQLFHRGHRIKEI
jgi:hypothetical protein